MDSAYNMEIPFWITHYFSKSSILNQYPPDSWECGLTPTIMYQIPTDNSKAILGIRFQILS